VLVRGCDLGEASRLLRVRDTPGLAGYELEPGVLRVKLDANSGQEAEARVRKTVGEDCEVRAEPSGEGD
jgi:hypothetical protein